MIPQAMFSVARNIHFFLYADTDMGIAHEKSKFSVFSIIYIISKKLWIRMP